MTKQTEYQKDLIEALKDPQEAAAYINAAIEEGDRETFLLALRNVAEVNGCNEENRGSCCTGVSLP